MNSYGDQQPPRARASVPGSSGATPDEPHTGTARPAPDAYRRGSGSRGSASVGSASAGPAGRASVGGSPPGRASVGSASVGGASGSASVGSARPGGRASVGSAAVGGAAVGGASGGGGTRARAAVRPTSGGPGGPGGPGGGSGGGGSAGSGGGRSKNAKRQRRINILTAAGAVLVIMLGAGVVGGTYFFDSVDLPPQQSEIQSNVIKDADGNVLAKLGDQNRTVVPEDKVNQYMKDAIVAAEDKNFYTHHGIDMKGIVRAAWNNVTGGAMQGASTITQQYARYVANAKEISINRKLREAVIARKLESEYEKNQILGMYMNYIDLGEGRYGVEAAAQGYFGKSVLTPKTEKNALTPAEAAVIASIIKQPYPNKADGTQGFDPNYADPTEAQNRWKYTLNNMLEMKSISQQQYDQAKYPKVKPPNSSTCKTCAADKPVAMIFRHVKAELLAAGITKEEFGKGGLTITTTIEPKVQKAAEAAGSAKSKESPMNGRPKSYQAAVIGIDPNNGRVLGYYGGDNPVGTDYAGYMTDDFTGKINGGQSPGSSFKIYTLAAGQKENLSFDSTWDGSLKRVDGKKISNAGAEERTICSGKLTNCDLETATIKSYNFPFYWITEKIGVDKVLDAAKAAGVRHMYTDGGEQVDLGSDASGYARKFSNEVGFGQYRVVPLEHAAGVATIVNGGVQHKAHFIKKATRMNQDTGKTETIISEKIAGKEVFDKDKIADLDGVLSEIVKDHDRDLKGGRESIAKSGTWETPKGGSGDCWFVGGTKQIAATVWVGGAQGRVELKEPGGGDMFGSLTPARIWKKFLDEASAAMDYKNEDFPARIKTGDPEALGNGKKPPPPPPVQPGNDCILGFIGQCNNGQGNNGGQNNGGGNNGGQNNGGGQGNGNGQGNGGQNNGGQGPGGGQGDGNSSRPGTGQGNNNGGTLPTFPAQDGGDDGGGE